MLFVVILLNWDILFFVVYILWVNFVIVMFLVFVFGVDLLSRNIMKY